MSSQLSLHGTRFLQDAFAPPDFQIPRAQGVPDAFCGDVLIKEHFYSGSFVTGTAVQDTVIVVPPTPGVAYTIDTIWPANVAVPSVQTFAAVPFNDTQTFFPYLAESRNVVKFRYNSLCVELIPLTAPLQSTGSISVIKFPVGYDLNSGKMSGDGGITTLFNKSPYVQPTLSGAYSVSTHRDPSWDFEDVVVEWSAVNPSGTTIMGSVDNGVYNVQYVSSLLPATPPFTGFGDFDAIGIRLSGMAAASSYSIRVWATIEYQVNPGGTLIEYTVKSPDEDKMAMALYKTMAETIPMAVPHAQNASFWKSLMNIISTGLSSLGTLVSGPWGLAASGAGTLASAFGNMMKD